MEFGTQRLNLNKKKNGHTFQYAHSLMVSVTGFVLPEVSCHTAVQRFYHRHTTV